VAHGIWLAIPTARGHVINVSVIVRVFRSRESFPGRLMSDVSIELIGCGWGWGD